MTVSISISRSRGLSRHRQDGTKDVLIATDIAAKGLDFPDIQHVINFDMPDEIENYVHRIGRTGRCGKTGVATTFINKARKELCSLFVVCSSFWLSLGIRCMQTQPRCLLVCFGTCSPSTGVVA